MAGQTLGVIDIIWRGTALDVEKGAKVKIGGFKQNAMPVQGKTKWSREYEPSEITATVPVGRGMDVPGLFAGGEGELQCNCDTGQSFIFPDAFVTNRPEMTGGDGGKMEVHWGAASWRCCSMDDQPDRVVMIDMTDPEPGKAAPVDDPSVVVVPAEKDDNDALPENAALQPDGSVVLTLRFPVTMRWRRADSDQVREEKRDSLTMHRLNGAAMRAVMNAGKGHMVTTGIAKSCRMPQAVFDKLYDMMDGLDATAAAQVLNFFLYGGIPKATGQPNSP